MTTRDEVDRAHGALLGLAVGDALGMPTQMMRRAEVVARWGRIERFEPGPPDNEIAPGVPAGRVTDDTDQAVILGWLLVEGHGRVDLDEYARRLLAWQDTMVAIGSLDLLGPSTLKALTAYRSGVPAERTGRWGDTNGAAMRVAPVGILCPPEPLATLVGQVAAVDALTHDTGTANAGAAAVAAVVSAGVAGWPPARALAHGVTAARAGAAHGSYVPGAEVAARIEWAVGLVSAASCDEEAVEVVVRLVGTSVATQEAVPAAFAIATRFGADPFAACCAAASLGGDSDTVAAMVGAMLGACHGASAFPAQAVSSLAAANPDLRLRELAVELLAVRHRTVGERR